MSSALHAAWVRSMVVLAYIGSGLSTRLCRAIRGAAVGQGRPGRNLQLPRHH